ncbi:MAG: hypothetical protein NC328_05845 [Muribaculum sp.]|nr:hypothetical protein [Muribaculum sp.]
MKKFLLLAAAAFLAGSAAAADWYLCGGEYGWNDGSQYKFVQSEANANVYTLDLTGKSKTYLSGDIKVKEAGTWSTSFGSNGSKLKADVLYNASTDGGNISVDGKIENAVLTINIAAHTILVEGKATENEYSEVYLVGDFGSGWNEDIATYPLTLKEGTSNTYEGSYALTASTSYFKMKAGSLVYGTGGDDISVAIGTTYTASQSGNAFSIAPGSYTFTYVLDKNADTGELTVTQDGPVSYPDRMYIIGNVNLAGWKADNGIQMTTEGEGLYTATATIDNEMDATAGYFSFTAGLGASADDWSGMGVRYGADADEDTPVELGRNMAVAYGETAFKIAGGKYEFTLDLKEKTLKVTEYSEPDPVPDPEPEVPTTISATSDIQGTYSFVPETTDAEPTLFCSYTTDKESVTVCVDVPKGFDNWMIFSRGSENIEPTRADVEWMSISSVQQMMGGNVGNTVTVNAGKHAEYVIALVKGSNVDVNPSNWFALDVTVVKSTEPEPPFVAPEAPATISCTYDTDKVNGTVTTNEESIDTERGLTFDLSTALEEVNINLNIPEGFDNFLLIDLMNNLGGIDNEPLSRADVPDGWYTVEQTKQVFRQSMGQDLVAEVGHSFTVKANDEMFLIYAFLVKDGYVNTNVRYELTGVVTSEHSGVQAIEAAEESVYYDVNGVKVANPGKGLYIKVTGAKAEKVIK